MHAFLLKIILYRVQVRKEKGVDNAGRWRNWVLETGKIILKKHPVIAGCFFVDTISQ